MKIKYFIIPIISSLYLLSCSTNKHTISDSDLSDKKLIILGVIEYDYTQVVNKKIKGLNVFLESKEDHSNISLPKKYLQKDKIIRQQFISLVGNVGVYKLYYKKNLSSTETSNLLDLMNTSRNQETTEKVALQEYSVDGGKILNIGKIVVKYKGGEIIDGKINYSYSFQTNSNDTLALSAFRNTYSPVYNKYVNDIYMFKSK